MSMLAPIINISIADKRLFSYKSFRLHQCINDHHRFELTLDNEVAAEALKLGTEWLGKRMQAWCEGRGRPCSTASSPR